jgi:hypothetical protein
MYLFDKGKRFLCLTVLGMSCVGFAGTQPPDSTGVNVPLGSYAGPQNLSNLNTNISIPVITRAGRGLNFTYNLQYNTNVWLVNDPSGVLVNADQFGWQGDLSVAMSGGTQHSSTPCGYHRYWQYRDYVFTDQSGTVHSFPNVVYNTGAGCGTNTLSEVATMAQVLF